uniref:Reverse transcriptase domain-containing protein n=1 Tax=Meloidogyne incognita TaxID=6306 RepID=A0A914NNU8_MELIC
MKRFTKGHSPIPYLVHNGLYFFEDKAKCDLFARAFAPSFSNVPIQNHPILPQSTYSSQLDDIDFTLIDIVNILKSLPPKEGVSADGISYKLLKNCTDSIAPFLADIFRDSLDSGILPELWKISFITPIFKKGSVTDVSNYRPIAITSCICRVFERLILQHILSHLEANKIISDQQFGFLKKRSTVTHLLSSFDAWYKALLNNKCIDCIFIDFKKAFDSVPIRYLIYKLSNIGIKGKLLNWISNFLSNRTAFVKINNNYSDPIPIMSGIPQGTIIANSDNACLQESLIKIEEWCSDWALDISLNKTCTFHIGKNNPRKRYIFFGTTLQTVSSVT